MKIFEDIKKIKGIGEKTASLFNKLGIYTIDDLIHYYPRTYISFESPISTCESTFTGKEAFKLTVKNDFRFEKKKNLNLGSGFTTDGINDVYIVFFNMPYLKEKLRCGSTYIFVGKLQQERDYFKLEHPLIYTQEEYKELQQSYWPIYSLTKGLSNKTLIKALTSVFETYNLEEDDFIPQDAVEEFNLISHDLALRKIHFPKNIEEYSAGRKRLAFEELFIFLFAIKRINMSYNRIESNFNFIETAGAKLLIEKLPYKLTKAQIEAYEEIKNDLTSGYVMNRMIQGDVGSGKTIVSFLGALSCIENSYQCVLMAPTELLAEQHFKNLLSLTDKYNLPFKPVLLTGSLSSKQKEKTYEIIKKSEANIIVGTHAVFQEKVEFGKLALVITDEQHRFGVKQRESLAQKGNMPHILVMSATPIPRSLSMVLYGDMHLSVIDEKPSNRLPIKNCVVNTSFRPKAYDFILNQIKLGHQAYIICPMVEESEGLDGVENVIDYTEKIKKYFPSSVNISFLHGKMKPINKQNIMNDFLNKNIDILVSTTVIEVGIDVPNATVIMVENAERFGLSQLHQLRGRIGRGDAQSYTIFVNTSKSNSHNKRLDILNKTNDGFEVAREDLKLRGAGDIFGIRQSGAENFEIADIIQDSDLIVNINQYIDGLLQTDPLLEKDANKKLSHFLKEGNNKFIDFSTI